MYNIVELKNEKHMLNKKLNGNFKIISVGRLSKEKNHELLVKVHKKLIDNGYNVNTYIIGSGDEYNSLCR